MTRIEERLKQRIETTGAAEAYQLLQQQEKDRARARALLELQHTYTGGLYITHNVRDKLIENARRNRVNRVVASMLGHQRPEVEETTIYTRQIAPNVNYRPRLNTYTTTWKTPALKREPFDNDGVQKGWSITMLFSQEAAVGDFTDPGRKYQFRDITVHETATNGTVSVEQPCFILGIQSDEYGNEYSTIQNIQANQPLVPGADGYVQTVGFIRSLSEEL